MSGGCKNIFIFLLNRIGKLNQMHFCFVFCDICNILYLGCSTLKTLPSYGPHDGDDADANADNDITEVWK